MQAQYFGAVGAILYNDPADYAPFGTTPDKVYDQQWYMPPSGTQRGTATTAEGDPLTPIYPSKGLRIDQFSKGKYFMFGCSRLYVPSERRNGCLFTKNSCSTNWL
jgi:hypothetical protein